MDQWGWVAIVSAVAVFTLVQLVAYYYLTRGRNDRSMFPSSASDGSRSPPRQFGPTDETNGTSDEGRPDPARKHRDSDPGADDDGLRRCSECGTPNENDPVYTYCRNCGAQL